MYRSQFGSESASIGDVYYINSVPKWGRAMKGEDNEINLAWLASV